MIITKTKNGYKIIVDLSYNHFAGTYHKEELQITVDYEFDINIPAISNLKSNQIDSLLDGIVMANALKKKEIIFNNER